MKEMRSDETAKYGKEIVIHINDYFGAMERRTNLRILRLERVSPNRRKFLLF